MGINQAIYTSSAKGIDKGGGMGIHTYNYACSEGELRDFELSYCQYYFDGDAEDIPKQPTKVVYGKSGDRYMQACVTYIGKDYDKERGRMGNLLSHMYSFAKEDLTHYPMEYYKSADYRTSIALSEVDGTDPVDYLPEKRSIATGPIAIDDVQDFLGDDRMEMFCHLMGAVLKRDSIHKIIIYDTHEHILLWLAAIQFALPLKSAREVTYCSYERDPMMSEFDIRGAVCGMSSGNCYDYENGGQFYVFDGIHKEYPKFDVSADYYQYGIEMGLAFSYDSIKEFFKFLERYEYEKADLDLLNGFELYQMIQNGMSQLGDAEFNKAISFEANYGNQKTYREMLKELFDKLEESSGTSENILENIRTLLGGYLKKQLTQDEITFILSLVVKLDKYVAEHHCDMVSHDKMWQSFYEIMHQSQSMHRDYICKNLIVTKRYQRLAEFEAYIFKMADAGENSMKYVKSIFNADWRSLPEEQYVYYDAIILVAAENLRKYEDDEDKLEAALELFLWAQEEGKGNIAGRGCEKVLRIIERLTDITDKKLFVKKRKTNEELEKMRAKCAFEAFNYTQKNSVNLPIAKIRMYHLAKCVVSIYDEEQPLTKSKVLGIYAKYPIEVGDMESEEFGTYMEQLMDLINTLEMHEDEYRLLLTFWKLKDSQKEIAVEVFMNTETEYFRKEKEVGSLCALLTALDELKDDAYQAALESYVSEMKDTRKEKILEALREKRAKEAYYFWKKLCEVKPAKREKKGFFGFGKR